MQTQMAGCAKVNISSKGFINLHTAHLRCTTLIIAKKNRLIKCSLIPFLIASRRLNCAINHVRYTLFTEQVLFARRFFSRCGRRTEVILAFRINQKTCRTTSNMLPLQRSFVRCIFSLSSWARSVMEW